MKKVTEAIYLKRKNLGNYEHSEMSLAGLPDDDQSAEDLLKELKEIVDRLLDGEDSEKEVKEKEDTNEKESHKKSSKKSVKKSVEEEVVAEKEEEATEAPEETEEPVKKEKKKKKPKATEFNFNDDVHTDLLSEALDKKMKGWETKYKSKIKSASLRSQGQDFLDENGDVIEAFVIKYMNKLKA
jgi:outer membrane biosynthesis protein TonB